MARPPFDMQRACFALLAFVIVIEILMTVLGGLGCMWHNYTVAQEIGFCMPVVAQIREQWAEVLTAILALLLAARTGPPPPPPPDQRPSDKVC